jgi:hypothetical protein
MKREREVVIFVFRCFEVACDFVLSVFHGLVVMRLWSRGGEVCLASGFRVRRFGSS